MQASANRKTPGLINSPLPGRTGSHLRHAIGVSLSRPPATAFFAFASVVNALRCAAEMQAALAKGNAPMPPHRCIAFRIGINMGDIVVEDGDIFGDGINVTARLEGLAEPGGICVLGAGSGG